jgi:hypothetical protein
MKPQVWGGQGPYKDCRATDYDDDDDDWVRLIVLHWFKDQYTLMFRFVNMTQVDKRVYDERYQIFPGLISLNFIMDVILIYY